MMKNRAIAGVLAVGLWAGLSVGVASAAESAALSPQMEAALRQFSSASYEDRAKAVKAAEQALADQVRQIMAVNDPEAEARVSALLEFNDALLKWAGESMKLPPEERAKQYAWGLKADVFPVVAKVYSTNVETRVAGIKELGKIEGAEASSILARQIAAEQREVYLAAMEAVWDRPATPDVVDALWNRAVEDVLAYRDVGAMLPPPKVTFRGQPLGAVFAGNYFNMTRIQDNALAADVLIQLKGPLVSKKVAAFLERVEKVPSNEPERTAPVPYMAPLRNVYRIVEASQYKETLPALIRLATAKSEHSGTMTVDKVQAVYSNRTGALAVALILLKQNPVDYKLLYAPQGTMWVTAAAADEDEAIVKLQAFWEKHKSEYVEAAKGAETKP
jgi:hypothetical protein